MISYNPKKWLRFIFEIHKADTVRKLLPWLALLIVYTWGIAYVMLEYFHLTDKSNFRNVTILHTLLGFAISMLLVFRTNTAYDRWWEGRRQWGALVNASRNLAVKFAALLENDKEERRLFAQLIASFAFELKNHLQLEETRWMLDENKHPEIPNFDRNGHVPNQIAARLVGRLHQLLKTKIITGEQLLFINNDVTAFLDICGACERIKNTPIPFSYSTFIKKFIFFYVITLPVGLVFSLGYLTIAVVVFVFYVLGSLELIAEEIEDPFGKDSNDLPMQRLCENIHRNVSEILA